MQALILFSHGARDPLWARPFERICEVLAARVAPTLVRMAFLEFMVPDLESAAAEVIAAGAREIIVVPLFLGGAGHVQRDLPSRLAGIARTYPAVKICSVTAAGEDARVVAALVDYCAAQLDPFAQQPGKP